MNNNRIRNLLKRLDESNTPEHHLNIVKMIYVEAVSKSFTDVSYNTPTKTIDTDAFYYKVMSHCLDNCRQPERFVANECVKAIKSIQTRTNAGANILDEMMKIIEEDK